MASQTDPTPILTYAAAVPRPPRRPPFWWQLAFTVACMYLPYAWLVMGHFPWGNWGDYRWQWIRMWPVLPGLMMGVLIGPHASHATLVVAMGMMTVPAVGLFLLLAARSRRWLPVTTLLALALSALNSWIAYGIYRA